MSGEAGPQIPSAWCQHHGAHYGERCPECVPNEHERLYEQRIEVVVDALKEARAALKDAERERDARRERKILCEQLERERERLRRALEGLMPGSPWDIDQDCRYCSSHYEGHNDDCPWALAREALQEPAPQGAEAGE